MILWPLCLPQCPGRGTQRGDKSSHIRAVLYLLPGPASELCSCFTFLFPSSHVFLEAAFSHLLFVLNAGMGREGHTTSNSQTWWEQPAKLIPSRNEGSVLISAWFCWEPPPSGSGSAQSCSVPADSQGEAWLWGDQPLSAPKGLSTGGALGWLWGGSSMGNAEVLWP